MNRNRLRVLLAFFLATGSCFAQTLTSGEVAINQENKPQIAAPPNVDKWYVRVGVSGVIYHPSANITVDDTEAPGASATIDNNVAILFDGGYYFTKNIAASLMAGIPPKTTLRGAGTIAGYGNLGTVWWGPGILTAHYHLRNLGPLQPYAGAGFGYAIMLKKHNDALDNLAIHNNFAPVVQGGTDYMFNKKWGAFIDCKQIWLSVDAHGNIAGVVPAKARVKIYPTTVWAGVEYHF